jgi:hypothetical protein
MKAHAKKATVDHRVSCELGLPIQTVHVITQSFLQHARACLVEYAALDLRELGRFQVFVRECVTPKNGRLKTTHVVSVVKSPALAKAINNRNKEMPYGQVRSGRVDRP